MIGKLVRTLWVALVGDRGMAQIGRECVGRIDHKVGYEGER